VFSVIIPLYNKAAYVEKTIQSVLSQTYQEFELIVVNDGSTDDSLYNLQFRICNLELEQPDQFKKIKIIDQPNQGVSVARNNGVNSAIYDYIAFIDADDWWEPTYLQETKTLIETYPEAGIYGSSYYIVKNGRKHIAPIGVKPDFKAGVINYFQVYANTLCMPLWTGATIIKKNIFESEKGFKPNLKLGEDFDLWVRVALNYPVAFLNKPLAYYNQDVELANRAIGFKLYEPEEHMLFTDYAEFMKNPDFRFLFERLAVYGLLPYYLAGKNISQVNQILSSVLWKNHSFKYFSYYKIFPKSFVQAWVNLNITGSSLKKIILRNILLRK
jgi:glycosyltransferase involved in cell wall biosynthesis